MSTPNWQLLSPPNAELFAARVQLHHALQPAASVGHTFVPAISDQSHSNFEWIDELGELVGKVTADGYRAGLRFHDLTLLLLTAEVRGGLAEPKSRRRLTASCARYAERATAPTGGWTWP